MIPENNIYPSFEVNQVLSAAHLNTLHDQLDEQSRLTRATLHGIGIVCGYEEEAKFRALRLEIAISFAEFQTMLPNLPKDKMIIFYCA